MNTEKDKGSYRQQHESTIVLHEAAAKVLRKHAGDGGKLPNPSTLQAEYSRLAERKDVLQSEYGNLKRLAREYSIVQKNIDSILNPSVRQQFRGKERSAEL